jgi:hypothetical protein
VELQLTITADGDTWQVSTTPWVIMQWERRYKTKASTIAQGGLGIEDLAYMAYEATKLSGRTVPISFDAFAQAITNIEVGTGADEARPTVAAPSAD